MAAPILTLTTDFGLSDHYAGTMKGVILGICPEARIVDISHEVTPFEIPEGAYVIAQAYRYFPPKTIHVVVVDPGVGSARRPVLMEAAGQYFVAPDNGVLAMIFAQEPHRMRLIANQNLFLKPVSRTFHGRDIFAPVAAHLAAGVPPPHIGEVITDYLRPASMKPQRSGKRTWQGRILKIDRFGNMISNFHIDEFPTLLRADFTLAVGPRETSILARTYAEASPGELFALVGSSGFIEFSLSQGSAAKATGCGTGGPVELKIWG